MGSIIEVGYSCNKVEDDVGLGPDQIPTFKQKLEAFLQSGPVPKGGIRLLAVYMQEFVHSNLLNVSTLNDALTHLEPIMQQVTDMGNEKLTFGMENEEISAAITTMDTKLSAMIASITEESTGEVARLLGSLLQKAIKGEVSRDEINTLSEEFTRLIFVADVSEASREKMTALFNVVITRCGYLEPSLSMKSRPLDVENIRESFMGALADRELNLNERCVWTPTPDGKKIQRVANINYKTEAR